MTILSVNVNKLATLRNSRGKNNPDVLRGSLDLIGFGAQGITVHPRPDERHIRKTDVFELKNKISVELNVEGYPSEEFLGMVEKIKPAQCTLVPDPPNVLTSNAGWKVADNLEILSKVARRLHSAGVRTSVFIDPEDTQRTDFKSLAEMGVNRVELYTEKYAECFATPQRMDVTHSYKQAAENARSQGLGVNAGHDLSLENLEFLISQIPWIAEVSIGHALICDALYMGLETAVKRYLDCIQRGQKAAKIVSN